MIDRDHRNDRYLSSKFLLQLTRLLFLINFINHSCFHLSD